MNKETAGTKHERDQEEEEEEEEEEDVKQHARASTSTFGDRATGHHSFRKNLTLSNDQCPGPRSKAHADFKAFANLAL